MFDYRRTATVFLGNRWVNRLESCVCRLFEQFGNFQLVKQLAMKKYGNPVIFMKRFKPSILVDMLFLEDFGTGMGL